MPDVHPSTTACALCSAPAVPLAAGPVGRQARSNLEYTLYWGSRRGVATCADPDCRLCPPRWQDDVEAVTPFVTLRGTDGDRVTLLLCPTCATDLARARTTTCPCGNGLSSTPYAYLRARRLHRSDDPVPQILRDVIAAAERGGLANDRGASMTSTGVIRGVLVHGATLAGRPSRLLCTTCVTNALTCSQCATLMTEYEASWCEDCDVTVCGICWGAHDRCNLLYDAEYDPFFDRHNWTPRADVYTALALDSQPGSVISSLRAVGMEVETSGGEASPVVEREADAAIPVLAAVGTDGSVTGRNPVEYRLLPARGAWAEYAIRSMHTWCAEAGYEPNNSAGVHMHLDMTDVPAEGLWKATAVLYALEPVIMAHAAESRRDNSYCQVVGADRAGQWITACLNEAERGNGFYPSDVLSYDRYFTINPTAYHAERPTLEVRAFDSDHSSASIERYLDMAAMLTAAVDFAVGTGLADWLSEESRVTFGQGDAESLLAAMVADGHLPVATAMRIWGRMSGAGWSDWTAPQGAAAGADSLPALDLSLAI